MLYSDTLTLLFFTIFPFFSPLCIISTRHFHIKYHISLCLASLKDVTGRNRPLKFFLKYAVPIQVPRLTPQDLGWQKKLTSVFIHYYTYTSLANYLMYYYIKRYFLVFGAINFLLSYFTRSFLVHLQTQFSSNIRYRQ